MSGSEPFVRGEILFEGEVEPFSGATVYVRLEDISRADAVSRVVMEQVMRDVSYEAGNQAKLDFNLYGQVPEKQRSYAVRVHIDVDRDGQVSRGDYISVESYPVSTLEYPHQISVRVRKIQ